MKAQKLGTILSVFAMTVGGGLILASYAARTQSGEPAHQAGRRGNVPSDAQWVCQNPLPQGNNGTGEVIMRHHPPGVLGSPWGLSSTRVCCIVRLEDANLD